MLRRDVREVQRGRYEADYTLKKKVMTLYERADSEHQDLLKKKVFFSYLREERTES